ncbi:hypothetical protein [Bacillus sp. OV322]|uniref:hypothetical protein n=1 Tax=Bacillus sp. OV322 TaxID=1882764 RepID=UPI000B8973C3|nr:hypothetical protein [Bacillus sp. OV322]
MPAPVNVVPVALFVKVDTVPFATISVPVASLPTVKAVTVEAAGIVISAGLLSVRLATVFPAPIFKCVPALGSLNCSLFPLAFSFQVEELTLLITTFPLTVAPLFTVAPGTSTVKLPVITKLRRLIVPVALPVILTSPSIVREPVAGP